MPYVGQKPADIISTAVDTVTGTFSGNVTTGGTLGVTGAVTANAGVVVDEMTLDGDTLTATDDFILDVAGDITLDADGEDIIFKDAGVEIGRFSNSGTNNFSIKSSAQDKDIFFKGNDGGATITALTLDMSAAGEAKFNDNIVMGTANKGIYLGVTSATASNLLDDYEEGSFDVAMADGTSHSLTQNASYTKIGRMVHFQAKVIFPDTGTDTTSTKLSLPFTVSSRTNYFASTVVGSNGSANAQICIGIGGTATFLLQNINGSTGATNQHLSGANLNISLHYETT